MLFTGKQAKPMQEYFSIYFIKEKQLLQTKGKDTLQLYGEREEKKKTNLNWKLILRPSDTK